MKFLTHVMPGLLMASLTCTQGLAQEQPKPDDGGGRKKEMAIGIKLGANYANVYDDEGEDFIADPKIGGVAGGFIYLPFASFIGIQPEILYAQKGFEGTGSIDGETYSLERTTAFIDVPILLAIKPVPFVTLLAGPQYSFLLSQRDNFTSEGMSVQVEQEFDNDNLRQNIMGVTGGVDINLLKFVVSGRAGWDLVANRGDGTSSTPRYKNVWVQATIGLRF